MSRLSHSLVSSSSPPLIGRPRPSSASLSPPPRRPIQRACDLCHARKVKCDGTQPCARCTKGGVHCSFDNPKLPKGPPRKRLRRSREGTEAESTRRQTSARHTPVECSRRQTPECVCSGRAEYAETYNVAAARIVTPEAPPTSYRPRSTDRPCAVATPVGPSADSSSSTSAEAPLSSDSPIASAGVVPGGSAPVQPTAHGSVLGRNSAQLQPAEPLSDFDSLLFVSGSQLAQIDAESPEGTDYSGSEQSGSPTSSCSDDWEGHADTADSGLSQGDTEGTYPVQSMALTTRPSSAGQLGGSAFPPLSPVSLSWLNDLGAPSLGDRGGAFPPLSFPGAGRGNIGVGPSDLTPPPHMFNMPFTPPADVSPILSLTLETLVKPQLDVFYSRVYSMMPVFSASYIHARMADPSSMADRTFAALLLAMVALSLIHPLTPEEMTNRYQRARKATMLLDEVCRLRSHWDYGGQPSLQAVLTSYLMFGTLHELGHTSSARFRLNESIIMAHTMRLGDATAYTARQPEEIKQRMVMYWMLAITERSYALQRAGTIIFRGPIRTSVPGGRNVEGTSLHHLARVFTFIDADIVACWNGECDRTRCTTLTEKRAVSILRRLKGTAADVFGDEDDLLVLTETQKADLLVTWQWIRNRIWRLASAHGLMRDGAPSELSLAYVVDVAATTVSICSRLSDTAMEAHGIGFVEKLYDIASIVTELLQTTPGIQAQILQMLQTGNWVDMLERLGTFVTRHRAGAAFAAPLEQAISLVLSIRLLTEG